MVTVETGWARSLSKVEVPGARQTLCRVGQMPRVEWSVAKEKSPGCCHSTWKATRRGEAVLVIRKLLGLPSCGGEIKLATVLVLYTVRGVLESAQSRKIN